MPGVDVWPVEGQSVVRDVVSGIKGVERGDIVAAVGGEPVERRRKVLMDMYPHSTPQAGLLMINQFLLAGHEPTVKIRILKSDGRHSEVMLARTEPLSSRRSTPAFGVLPSGYGYIDVERVRPEDADLAFDAVMKAPGLILDMRGMPGQDPDRIAARLTGRSVPAALIRRKVWHGPDPDMATFHWGTQSVLPSDKPKYSGRVVVLIDARAISRPEYMCLLLEAAANVTFLGSPTKGAVGEVTNTILPGDIQVNFAGSEMRHADGRPLQGVGILPHVWVAPTISGIRQGRDEVLEKAVEFLKLSDSLAREEESVSKIIKGQRRTRKQP